MFDHGAGPDEFEIHVEGREGEGAGRRTGGECLGMGVGSCVCVCVCEGGCGVGVGVGVGMRRVGSGFRLEMSFDAIIDEGYEAS